jgi:hypothetical protein
VERLDTNLRHWHSFMMTDVTQRLTELDDEEAEAATLRAAVEAARADPPGVPHTEIREWLLKIAAADFLAEPPIPRQL